MTTFKRRSLGVVISAVIVVALVLFARHVDWSSVMQALRSADARLLTAAILVNFVSLWFKSVQWWVLIRRVGVKSLWLVTRATTIGAALNTVLIAQGGEGGRVLIVARESRVPSARVVASLALDRVIDFVSYAVILAVAASAMDLPPELSRWRGAVIGSALAIIVALYFIGRPSTTVPVIMTADAFVETFGSRIREYLRTLRSAAQEMSGLSSLSAATCASMIAWILQGATYHLVALAAHSPLPLAGSIAALLACTIGFVVRATPGSVGIFQVVYVLSVRPFGITESAAVAIAILIQAIQVIPTLAVAALLAPSSARVPKQVQVL